MLLLILCALAVALYMFLYLNTDASQKDTQVMTDYNSQGSGDSSGNVSNSENGQSAAGAGNSEGKLNARLQEALKKSIIVIDPGHGGDDYGTCSGKLFEKDINLDVSLQLGELLKQAGIKVLFTRDKDEYIGLKSRANLANDIGASLFISVHVNGMDNNDTTPRGSETLYYTTDKYKDASLNSKKLARIVQAHMVEKLGTRDNGIIYRPKLAVLHLTKMPAIIAEVAYISNPSDREKLASEDFRYKAAQALYDASIEALKLKYKDTPDTDK